MSDLKELYSKHGTSEGDLFYAFLNSMPNWKISALDHMEPYIAGIIKQEIISADGFTNGMNRFIKLVPDLEIDCPNLANHCASLIYMLLDQDLLHFNSLIWIEEAANEEDATMVEAYFKLFALLLETIVI